MAAVKSLKEPFRRLNTIQLRTIGPTPMAHAAYLPLHTRHNSLYASSALPPITSGEPFYQDSELEEVRHPEERALRAHEHLRIRGIEVRPLWGHGANSPLVNL
jgi:hypothetical protein